MYRYLLLVLGAHRIAATDHLSERHEHRCGAPARADRQNNTASQINDGAGSGS
jgi:hypothetical protein